MSEKHFIDNANYKQTLQALNSGTTKGKMVHYRPKSSRTCPHDTTFIYKPKEATNPTKVGLLSLRLSLYMLGKVWTYQKARTYISFTSNVLFRSLSMILWRSYIPESMHISKRGWRRSSILLSILGEEWEESRRGKALANESLVPSYL